MKTAIPIVAVALAALSLSSAPQAEATPEDPPRQGDPRGGRRRIGEGNRLAQKPPGFAQSVFQIQLRRIRRTHARKHLPGEGTSQG